MSAFPLDVCRRRTRVAHSFRGSRLSNGSSILGFEHVKNGYVGGLRVKDSEKKLNSHSLPFLAPSRPPIVHETSSPAMTAALTSLKYANYFFFFWLRRRKMCLPPPSPSAHYLSAFLSLSAADADAAEHTTLVYNNNRWAGCAHTGCGRPTGLPGNRYACSACKSGFFFYFILPRFVLFTRFYSCFIFFSFRYLSGETARRDRVCCRIVYYYFIFFPFSSVAVSRNTNTVYAHPTQ